jgi:hypothetical protein
MINVQEDLKNLDDLITYIECDLIGEHKEMKYIDEGIKLYSESFHNMKLKMLSPIPAPRWIPCTEQLPEDNLRVLCLHKRTKTQYISWRTKDVESGNNKWYGFSSPDYWQRLPDPI